MGLKIFEFILGDDEDLGMKAISLVDKPAIESEYIAFNKQEKKQNFIQFQDEKKYIVAGLALIPDKLIYRVDEATGEDYLGYFSAETIEAIADKFMKESTSGTLQNVNFQHNSEDKAQAHLVESFILRTDAMVEAVKAMGIKDAVKGAWFVSYKFDNKEDYEEAISGGFKGFSIEVMLQRELKLSKNNNEKNNEKFMTKVKNFIDKFKSILTEFENEGEIKLEEGKIADSDIVLRWGEVGQPVLKVAIAEDGTETLEPMPEGEYVLETGDVLVIDAMGNLLEIKPKAEAPAPIPEEELAEEEKPVEEEAAEEIPEEAPMPEEEAPKDVTSKTLGEIVDVSKDGEYVIKVVVSGGAVTEASVEAAQDLIKKADFEAVQLEVTSLKEENAELKDKIEKIEVKPLFNEFTTIPEKQISKEEKAKMNNLQYHLKKLGLDKE